MGNERRRVRVQTQLLYGHHKQSTRMHCEDTHNARTVLELGFAEPVQVDADVLDLGETQGVEAHVASHGAVQLRSVRLGIDM